MSTLLTQIDQILNSDWTNLNIYRQTFIGIMISAPVWIGFGWALRDLRDWIKATRKGGEG